MNENEVFAINDVSWEVTAFEPDLSSLELRGQNHRYSFRKLLKTETILYQIVFNDNIDCVVECPRTKEVSNTDTADHF